MKTFVFGVFSHSDACSGECGPERCGDYSYDQAGGSVALGCRGWWGRCLGSVGQLQLGG